MEQESEEIRQAFPEYLTNNEEDDQILDICFQKFSILYDNYKDEQNILSTIESKITMVINQTPIHQIAIFYENIAKDFNLQQKIFRISKFHDQKHIPSIQILNQYFDKRINNIPWPTIGQISSEELQEQLIKIYNFNYGRIAFHELPLLWFPTLIKPYIDVLENLLNTHSKLTQYEKYYMAILGAASSGSEQLFELLIQHYFLNEGDKNWLDVGYEIIEDKIKSLDNIFKILVQKPWEQSLKQAIQNALKNKWNKSELIQSLLIFIFYNNLGCFSQGNGILKEIDHTHNLQSGNTSISFTYNTSDSQQICQTDFLQNEFIIQELKQVQNEEQNQNSEKQIIIKQKNKSIEDQQELLELDDEQLNLKFKEKFQKYFTHEEIKDSAGYQILRLSEFNFEMNSYPILKQIFQEGAQAIHDFVKEIKYMTRNSFGTEQQITTAAFRKAIRVYGQNIYRYQHDDIDYSTQMNKLLPKELKNFIKIVSLTPNLLQKKHLDAIPLKLNPDELCHITLLTIAAKLEVQLIYLSKALVDCM